MACGRRGRESAQKVITFRAHDAGMSRPETTTDALVLPTAAAWRAWLEEHADTSPGVWLAVRRRRGATLGVDFRAAVEHAAVPRLDRRPGPVRRAGLLPAVHAAAPAEHLERREPRPGGAPHRRGPDGGAGPGGGRGRPAHRGLGSPRGGPGRCRAPRPGGPAGLRPRRGAALRGLPALVAAADPGVGGRRPPARDPRAPHRRGRRLRRPGRAGPPPAPGRGALGRASRPTQTGLVRRS